MSETDIKSFPQHLVWWTVFIPLKAKLFQLPEITKVLFFEVWLGRWQIKYILPVMAYFNKAPNVVLALVD